MDKKRSKEVYNTLPELTGPYPSVFKPELASTDNSNITDGVRRLGDFIHLTTKTVDVRNRYTEAELNEHTSFIEDKMQALVENIGKLDSMLASKQLLRCGSSYSGTKILFPNEYDYMPVLANFNSNTVELKEVKDTCTYRNKVYGYIKLKPGVLSMDNIDKYTSDSGKYLCCRKFRDKLRELVIQSLQHMDTFDYIGVKDHDKKPSDSYSIGDISIHRFMHGPCIWLRVGGPLCTTDVDLCFSIEGTPTEQLGPCLMVYDNDCMIECDCGYTYSTHLRKSVIKPPVNTKYALSESHQELLITLKFISHLVAEMSGETYQHILCSYDVKTLLLHHQQTCQAINVGECFTDVVWRILDKPDDMNKISICLSTGSSIPDVFFPQRKLHLNRHHSLAAIAWFMIQLQVSHTEDDSWIHKLLSLTQEPHTHTWWDAQLTQSDGECEQLRGLLKTIRKVDKWNSIFNPDISPLALEWHNRDGSLKASLTLKYDE